MGCVDFRPALLRQPQSELLEEKQDVLFGVGVAGEDDFASVGGGQVDGELLYGGELFQNEERSQFARAGIESCPATLHCQKKTFLPG